METSESEFQINTKYFLYNDVGLLYETYLSQTEFRSATSLRRKPLAEFFKGSKDEKLRPRVRYYITNASSIKKEMQKSVNEVYYTEFGDNRIGGLLRHLRNAIMHGRYTITEADGDALIEFYDQSRSPAAGTNCVGLVELSVLRELIAIIGEGVAELRDTQ